MQLKKLFPIFWIAILAVGCNNSDELSPREIAKPEFTIEENLAADNMADFGINFFAAASKQAGDVNMAVSPFGASAILSMMANISDETSRTEILKILGIEDINVCNSMELKYLTWLPYADRKVDLAIAYSMWYPSECRLNPIFSGIATEFYNTEQYARDFSSPKLCDEINAWCYKNTHAVR